MKNNGLDDKYIFNHPINKRKDLNIDESYNYFLDFYFTDKKLVLEIDGNQHKYRKEHDDLRDERLLNVGIKTYRIKWKSINSEKGKEYIKKEIEKFLDYYNKNWILRYGVMATTSVFEAEIQGSNPCTPARFRMPAANHKNFTFNETKCASCYFSSP